jgi:hypothetical protein
MLFAGIVIATGCTSTPTPTPAAACGLVTNMDELVGRTAVGEPGAFTLNDVDRCLWTYANNPSRWVTVSVAAKAKHDEAIGAFGNGEAIPGLGEDARWWATNHLLSVATADAVLQVDLQLDDADATKELAVSIAEAALVNLN